MPNTHALQQMRLLAVLPSAVPSRITPQLYLVPMPLDMVVRESGGAARFFPRGLHRLASAHDGERGILRNLGGRQRRAYGQAPPAAPW